MLSEWHGGFARRAAVPGVNRFAEPAVLHDAIALIECDLDAEHVSGDHSIVVGRMRRVRASEDGRPLVYFGAFDPH